MVSLCENPWSNMGQTAYHWCSCSTGPRSTGHDGTAPIEVAGGGGEAGNGPRPGFQSVTPRQQIMGTEQTGNGTDLPGQQRRPITGLRLRPLPPCGDQAFPVLHDYFEVIYGPMIGPTSLVLARALNRHLADADGPVTVCPVELSLEIGLRARFDNPIGSTSHLAKALDRLAHHRLIEHVDPATLGVVVEVPPFSARALGKLPEYVQRAHNRFIEHQSEGLSDRRGPNGSSHPWGGHDRSR